MHAIARIYQPTKTAMQSGTRKTKHWVLEYEPSDSRFVEHIMGWTGNTDMHQQIELAFDHKEEAIRFAEQHRIPYRVYEPHRRTKKKRAYADNFAFNRIDTYQQVHKGDM